ncbi:MAG TPA: UDP-N-acetylmuramoyl-L-alanyl-D-glutamate--2,6-diaminopimelate ligase [Nitrospirae bacterium]|nr:UDP-N-acetylmuramoyl-L-alanyl-D-glutamate--L-lysine ligase [bacterium BMS3Abin06]HDH12454.1 UDP-N-acetylmuramoyl-L-alanyl-D-glutamate--2,6-diaminopimelate ligase [Nitrospirota bacterium]HDZ02409.1 UDP-N-acetylmuramoyl-L-alanyl-D-glutamate--2,6-diaminopimelate ligase [Nitrospirota bacterium]
MTVLKLLENVKVKCRNGVPDAEIKGIAYDSRAVEKDFLFVAVKGFSVDGHDYIEDAVNRGAAAVIAEHAVEITGAGQSAIQNRAALIEVPDSREALALISAAFYGHPSRRLSLIGITGTNGKTTTSFITKNIIDAGGEKTGLLGTIRYMTGDRTTAAFNTTPESLDLQSYLSEMVYNKVQYAVLEVSSHALALKRVEGCFFKVAAFTNFSQDHLDFHGTMDEYFRTKSKLFSCLDTGGTAVLNIDDPVIGPLAKKLDCNVITCGIDKGAMIRAENISEQGAENREHGNSLPYGLSFDVRTPEGGFTVSSGLIGRFNVYNILMSVGIAYALGIGEDVIQQGIRNTMPVEGRFEKIDEGRDFLCIVDYAHTDDALRKLIEEARSVSRGRVITVFGCGGDRDRTKRPLMGAAASELSDFVVVTSDNPRSEDPLLIMEEIVPGMKRNNYTLIPDREEAIMQAVSMAREGDIVLVAGKGHEDYQEIKGVRRHFSDREILRKAILKRSAISN